MTMRILFDFQQVWTSGDTNFVKRAKTKTFLIRKIQTVYEICNLKLLSKKLMEL